MMPTDQLIAASKANVETIIGLSQKAFEGAEKIVELNMNVARDSMAEAAEFARAAVATKDVQSLVQLQSEMLQPSAEKAAAYARSIYDVTAGLNSEWAELIEEQTAEIQTRMKALVEATAKNAPAGSENAVSLFRSTFAAANDAFEQANKAAKEAATAVDSNVRQFSRSVSKGKSAPKRRRAA
jgi:phasin family protein